MGDGGWDKIEELVHGGEIILVLGVIAFESADLFLIPFLHFVARLQSGALFTV